LNENRDIKQKRLDDLTAEANIMIKKLNAATKLISGLGRENQRWTDDTIRLGEKQTKLLGDCLLSSSFLSYSGPFDFSFRYKMIYEHW
jgi:dynein heavy chain